MKNDPFYHEFGSNCFGVALANALVVLNENSLAKKVIGECPKHPLQQTSGTPLGLTTRLLNDLTGGLYSGTLYVSNATYNMLETPESDKLITKIWEEEKEAGRIKPQERLFKQEYVNYPLLIGTRQLPMLKQRSNSRLWDPIPESLREGDHWITQLTQDSFLDMGFLVNFKPEQLCAIAMLTLQKDK